MNKKKKQPTIANPVFNMRAHPARPAPHPAAADFASVHSSPRHRHDGGPHRKCHAEVDSSRKAEHPAREPPAPTPPAGRAPRRPLLTGERKARAFSRRPLLSDHRQHCAVEGARNFLTGDRRYVIVLCIIDSDLVFF